MALKSLLDSFNFFLPLTNRYQHVVAVAVRYDAATNKKGNPKCLHFLPLFSPRNSLSSICCPSRGETQTWCLERKNHNKLYPQLLLQWCSFFMILANWFMWCHTFLTSHYWNILLKSQRVWHCICVDGIAQMENVPLDFPPNECFKKQSKLVRASCVTNVTMEMILSYLYVGVPCLHYGRSSTIRVLHQVIKRLLLW